jgi:hypothetical protein
MGEITKLGGLLGFAKQSIWVDSYVFPIHVVAFDFQNPSFFPDDPVIILIGMLD